MGENRKGVPRATDTFVLMFCPFQPLSPKGSEPSSRLVTLPEGSPVFRELPFSPVVIVMHRGGTNSGGFAGSRNTVGPWRKMFSRVWIEWI